MTQPLRPILLRGPGRFGLNTSQAVGTTDPRWALELTNAVFDDAGRAAARLGITGLTTTGAHSSDTKCVHEYIKDKDTTEIISAAVGNLYSGTTTLTDITGTSESGTANWKMVNFNGKCVAVQQGEPPIKYSGTSFATFGTTGAPPYGNDVLSAWGRLWITDEDRQGVSWCALLDEETWTGSGTGNLGLENYWPDGIDLTVGLAQWQDRLLIFGERSILIFSGAEDPAAATFVLSDIIDAGAVGRDAIVTVGNDLVFLSREGLRSISRAIEYENLPASIVSTNVRDALISDIASTSDYRMAYSETVGGIVAKIGVSYWYFDVKAPLESGDLRASRWDGIGWLSAHAATDGTIYFGMNGEVGDYSGSSDDGVEYQFRYRGIWLEAEGKTWIPKTARITLVTQTQTDATLVWAYDFVEDFSTDTRSTGNTLTASQWNISEWGLGEWSGGSALVRRLKYHLTGSGGRIQIGLTIPVTGEVAIEQIDLFLKLGRIAA